MKLSFRSIPDLTPGGEIRKAQRADVPRLVELWTDLMQIHADRDPRFALSDNATSVMIRRFHYLIQDRDALLLLSIEQDQVVGFAVGHIDQNLPFFKGEALGFVSDVYILPSHRRQGRARRLYLALQDWFRSRRVSSIQLHVAPFNPEAQAFWQSLGFREFLVRMCAEP